MKNYLRIYTLFFLFTSILPFCSLGQNSLNISRKDTTDLTFSGTKINPYDIQFDQSGSLSISGYVDCYFSTYSDTVNTLGFVKFPTISPRKNQFGLNMAQVSAKYVSKRFRCTTTLFTGDVPKSAWSEVYNHIQEANMGFQLYNKLWLDVGFFRTHIGLESIQPRENMTLSLATTTYYEPYFLSGAKLTYQHNDQWNFQINIFNSFNQFIDNNQSKAYGLSLSHNPNQSTSLTFSSILSDEISSSKIKRPRLYNNLCYTYKTIKWTIGAELNYGTQKKTDFIADSHFDQMYSGLLAIKYRITPDWSTYGRFEFFDDPNEILTGPVYNSNHQIIGPKIAGGTAGIEFKPIPNSYIRAEYRSLNNLDGNIFVDKNAQPTSQRNEFLIGIGVWF